jgi:long-subunit fatty acid transport protein
MRWIVVSCVLASALVAIPASATTTIYSAAYSGETAGMAGVANATEEDALSQAVNPANLTRIGSWRLDAGIGYLISRVTYDDGGVNPDAFGGFEYNEGHDFVVPGIAYAQRVRQGPWVLGLAAYGNGGNAIVFRNLGFNDTSVADMGFDSGLGGQLGSVMTGADDPAGGFGGLNAGNAVRRDNYATLQAGKVAVTAAVQVNPHLSLAFSPVLNIGILRFGTFGNFNTARNPDTGAFDGDYTTQVRGLPFGEFGNSQVTYADLFAGDTFPKILLDGGGQSGADGATRIAGLFQAVATSPTVGPALVGDLTAATIAAAGGDGTAIPNAVQAALGNLSPDFAATFGDAGFGLTEMAGYAEGGGLSGFGYNSKIGMRWQVNDWLAIGANYTQRAIIHMDNGTAKIDFSDQMRQAFNIGFRSGVAQQQLFGSLGGAFGGGLGDLATAYNTAGALPDADGDGNTFQDPEDLGAAIGQMLGGFADPAAVAGSGVIPVNDATGVAPGTIDAGYGDINVLTAAADGLLGQFAYLLGFRDGAAAQPFVEANVTTDPLTGQLAQVPNFAAVSTADKVAFLNAVGIQVDEASLAGMLDANSGMSASDFLAAFGGMSQQLNVTQSMDSQVDLELPQQAGIGVEIKATPKLTLGMDFTWIDFSDTFEAFSARIEGSGQDTVIEKFLGLENSGDSFTFSQEFEWDDQYIIAIGGAYQATDDLTLRLGYNHANNVVDAGNATPLFPAYGFDTVSGGVSYALSDHAKVSAAWEHAFDERLRTAGSSAVDSQYDSADITHGQDTIYLQYSLAY